MAKDEDAIPEEEKLETREAYCARVRSENAEAESVRERELKRRGLLEERFGPRLDGLALDERDALAEATFHDEQFAGRASVCPVLFFYRQDRQRFKTSWLVRRPLLIGISRMVAAEAHQRELQELSN